MRKARWTAGAMLSIVLVWTLSTDAQDDPTTGQPVFREPRTIIPSMNGGVPNVIRAVHDDQAVPRLVRKSDGTSAVVEERTITHTWDRVIPGNTYRVMPGETLNLTVVNDLRFQYTIQDLLGMKILGNNDGDPMRQFIHASMNITNLHVHGLHISPQGFQDNVLLHANPGRQIPYSYQLPKYHAPGTHWYHPHHHGSTALQVTQGMLGALLVGEPPGQNLTPSTWSALERLLIVRANGQQTILQGSADMDPALRTMLEEARPEGPNDDVQKLVQALVARTKPDLPPKITELDQTGDLEQLVQAVQDLLQPPTFTVNGLLNPVDELQPGQLVRLRIVNAGSRVGDYKEYFLEGHDLFLAAVDGINLVDLPKATGEGSFAGYVAYNDKRKLTLAPGNRADLYFIAKDLGSHALVMNQVPRFGELPQTTQNLMTFEVSQSDFSARRALSATGYDEELKRFLGDLDANLKRLQGTGAYAAGGYLASIVKAPVAAERTMTFAVTRGPSRPFLINNRSYNDGPAAGGGGGAHHDHAEMPGFDDYLGKVEGDGGVGPRGQTPWPIRRGTVEKWTIRNTSNRRHPFHIHVNPAWVVGIVENGKPVAAGDPRLGRWQDTIDLPPQKDGVPGEVTVLQRFDDWEGLYVLHCHILQHEDRGMMVNVMIMPPEENDKAAYFKKLQAENAELNRRING